LIFGDPDDASMGGIAYDNSTNALMFDANNAECIRIDSSGNVGIGTTTPQTKLHVQGVIGTINGTASAPPHSFYSDLDSGMFRAAVNTLGFSTGGTEKLRIDSSGNVGIGTTNPLYKLAVEGSVAVQDAQNLWIRGGRIGFENTALNNAAYIYNIGASGSSKLNIADSLYVVEAGNVGIGTDSPTARLNVKASGSTVDQIAVTHSGNTVEIAQLGQSANGNSGGALLLKNNGGTDKIYLDAAGSSYFNGGNVGIGTTSPATKFHVEGDPISTGVLAKFKGSADYGSLLQFDRGDSYNWKAGIGGGSASAGVPSSYFGIVEGANTPRLVIAHTTGNVGIGDTTPSYKLDVNGTLRSTGDATFDSDVTVSGDLTVSGNISGQLTKKISGDGTTTTFTVTHNFGTPLVMTQLLDYGDNGTGATYEVVNASIQRSSDNAIDVLFGSAPSSSEDYLVLMTKMPAIS
jgi:hypothetical protein